MKKILILNLFDFSCCENSLHQQHNPIPIKNNLINKTIIDKNLKNPNKNIYEIYMNSQKILIHLSYGKIRTWFFFRLILTITRSIIHIIILFIIEIIQITIGIIENEIIVLLIEIILNSIIVFFLYSHFWNNINYNNTDTIFCYLFFNLVINLISSFETIKVLESEGNNINIPIYTNNKLIVNRLYFLFIIIGIIFAILLIFFLYKMDNEYYIENQEIKNIHKFQSFIKEKKFVNGIEEIIIDGDKLLSNENKEARTPLFQKKYIKEIIEKYNNI